MDGPVNNHQYWSIDFVKKRKRLEPKVAELEKQTEYYKEEFRQFCNNYVSSALMNHPNGVVSHILIFLFIFRMKKHSGVRSRSCGFGFWLNRKRYWKQSKESARKLNRPPNHCWRNLWRVYYENKSSQFTKIWKNYILLSVSNMLQIIFINWLKLSN